MNSGRQRTSENSHSIDDSSEGAEGVPVVIGRICEWCMPKREVPPDKVDSRFTEELVCVFIDPFLVVDWHHSLGPLLQAWGRSKANARGNRDSIYDENKSEGWGVEFSPWNLGPLHVCFCLIFPLLLFPFWAWGLVQYSALFGRKFKPNLSHLA